MRHTFILCAILLFAMPVSNRGQNVDSLIHVLNTQKLTVDEQLELYKQIGNQLVFNDPPTALIYANKGLAIAEKEKKTSIVPTLLIFKGLSYNMMVKNDSAIFYFEQALELARKNKDEHQQSTAYINLGVAYRGEGNDVKALEYYTKALSLSEKNNNRRYIAMILGTMGSIHLYLNNETRALYYLERARKIAEEDNNIRTKITTYHDLANYYCRTGEHDKVLDYGWKTVDLCKETGNINFQSTSMSILAFTYYELKDYVKAHACVDTALVLARELGDTQKERSALMRLSELHVREGQFKECVDVCQQALELDSTYSSDALTLQFNLGIANMYLGNKEKAASHLWKYWDLSLEVNDKNSQEALANMEVKYETEKKELRIASLEKERQLYIWLVITVVLLMVVTSIVLRQKIKNEQKKRQLAAANAVQEGEMGERERLASELHDRLGGTLSAVKSELNNTKDILSVNSKLDECIEEVRRITHNMMPLSLRFGIKAALEDFTAQFPHVHFHFFGEERHIYKRLEFVIYCCANELVTNSLRHSGAENINLQLIQEENRIALTVQDNGCGFDKKSVGHGIGLKNIYDRVASCNGKIEIISSVGRGTETSIEFKLENI